jgi:hypothetical protein
LLCEAFFSGRPGRDGVIGGNGDKGGGGGSFTEKISTLAIDSRPSPTFATVTHDLPVTPLQLNVYGPAPPLASVSWPHRTALSFTLLPSHTAMVPVI